MSSTSRSSCRNVKYRKGPFSTTKPPERPHKMNDACLFVALRVTSLSLSLCWCRCFAIAHVPMTKHRGQRSVEDQCAWGDALFSFLFCLSFPHHYFCLSARASLALSLSLYNLSGSLSLSFARLLFSLLYSLSLILFTLLLEPFFLMGDAE